LVFCYFFVVETKNRTLEETAALFDGDEAVDHLAAKAAVTAGVDEKNEKVSENGSQHYVSELPK
jgi:hypothetical protein